MDSIMQYTDKGYEVEIWRTEHGYIVEIKHPCGELVEDMCNLNSKRNSVAWAVGAVNDLPFAYHHCENEYCDNNRYLKHFRR